MSEDADTGYDGSDYGARVAYDVPPRVPRREPEAVQQIADARAEPTIEELQAQAHDPSLDNLAQHARDGRFAAESEPAVTLTGPRLAAYLRLEAAAKAAAAVQVSLASTGQELRDAFGELCKAVVG